MKNYLVRAVFNIKADTVKEAEIIAANMQEAANDVYKKLDAFLLINENVPIEEGEIGIELREYK